ncbi:MAG: peptidase, partial [Gemmatimonadota bacterium]
EMAKYLPQIADVEARVRRGDRTADSTTYQVTVTWRNSGRLPTALRQAQLVKIVQDDRVELEFDSELTKRDDRKVRIVDPSRTDKTIYTGWSQPGESKSVTFELRTYGVPGVEGKVRVLSTRGGFVEIPVTIGNPEE